MQDYKPLDRVISIHGAAQLCQQRLLKCSGKVMATSVAALDDSERYIRSTDTKTNRSLLSRSFVLVYVILHQRVRTVLRGGVAEPADEASGAEDDIGAEQSGHVFLHCVSHFEIHASWKQ